jgi:virulence-associated protein VagC
MIFQATLLADDEGQYVVLPESLCFADGTTVVEICKQGSSLVVTPVDADKATGGQGRQLSGKE